MTAPDIPDAHERARLNTAFAATATETGFWDEHGNPAPWPADIDDWTPDTHQPGPQQPNGLALGADVCLSLWCGA